MKMNKEKKEFLFLGICFLVVSIIFLTSNLLQDRAIKRTNIEFPSLNTSDSLNDVVVDVYYPKGIKLTPFAKYVMLKDRGKTRFSHSVSLDGIISVGARLKKAPGNDTIWVFRAFRPPQDSLFLVLQK